MEFCSTGSNIFIGDTPRMQMRDSFIAFIREVNELLQREADLSPANPPVANMIRRLSLLLRCRYLPEEVQSILSHEYIRMNQRNLQNKLSEAEFLAELSDSRHICESEDSVMDIVKKLPSWNIYMALVGAEFSTLHRLVPQNSAADKLPIVFVGSGPLPISAIMLHLFSDAEVICLEIDAAAYDVSCSLLEHMGLGTKVRVVMENGSKFDYSPYSRIFVASLVKNKQAVLEQISRTSPNALVAVRTAEGMRRIMYESMDESQLHQQGWRILARTWPDENLVINSTLFLEYACTPAITG